MRLTLCVMSRSSKYVKRYVERMMENSLGKNKWKPATGWIREKPGEKWNYDEHALWSLEASSNLHGRQRPVLLQPMKERNIFVNDLVEVLVGPDKGKQGHIDKVVKDRNWCFVQGLHLKYTYDPGTEAANPGTCTSEEKPLMVTTEVALVDPSDGRLTDIEWRFTEDGERVRVSSRTGRIIPVPASYEDTIELEDVKKSSYRKGPRDTDEKDVEEVTFEPKLATFEDDIKEAMGIQEEKNPNIRKTYWY